MSSDPSVDDIVERELLDAESCLRRAAQQFPECTLGFLARVHYETTPLLAQLVNGVKEVAGDLAGKKFPGEENETTIAGISWTRSKPPPSRTGWQTEELLSAVLDSRLVGEGGEILDESPLERVLHVWNLGTPRLTALKERNIDGDAFCHKAWPEQMPWRVMPTAKRKRAAA